MAFVQSTRVFRLPLQKIFKDRYCSVNRRTMSVSASLTLAVKGDPDKNILGDCPFCHRVLLTMEQKALDYERIFIDFSKKPQWLLDVNPSGTVPVLKDAESYVPDSGAIVEYLEKKFPSPAVPTDEAGLEAGDGIFGALRAFFLNKDENEEDNLKKAFEGEVEKLNEKLKSVPGPFLGGSTFNAADCVVLPRLHHAQIALGHFKKWSIPQQYTKVTEYLTEAVNSDVWKRCEYAPELVIKGWGSKL